MVIHQATMEEAVPVARRLLADGVEVILGGGGTGSLLAQTIGQPIVKLPRSHLDVIEALRLARTHAAGGIVGLTSFAEPLDGIDVIEQLLAMRVRQIIFRDSAELEQGIVAAMREGVRCIVGGGLCRSIVIARGGVGVLAMPSREEIGQALREARALAAARRAERRQAQQIRATLETMKEGVIIVDRAGAIRFCNSVAAATLELSGCGDEGAAPMTELKALGLAGVLRSGKPEVDGVHRLRGIDLVVNASPITVDGVIEGAVATFKEASQIQKIDRKLKERLYAKGFVARYRIEHVKGASAAIASVITRARRYAETEATILIEGETGCGKEMLAQSIHNLSARRDYPFVAINCSALPESLLESELFGYEEGAFTGAKRGGKIGFFELANGGTLFLDEIADIPPSLQVRLLRVLEEKEIMRVGGDRILPIDVRVVVSTYKNLHDEVRARRFRGDLYFRLATLTLALPPLRARLEDLPMLVEDCLARHGAGSRRLTASMLRRLRQYSWPGNIRELDALVRRYVILLGDADGDETLFQTLFDELSGGHGAAPGEPSAGDGEADRISAEWLHDRVAAYERGLIDRALQACRYNKRETAERLGISVNTLWRKLAKPNGEASQERCDSLQTRDE